LGAIIHENREVTGLQVNNGKIPVVLTKPGPLAAKQVVNAAGAWAASIGRMLSINLPATNLRSHLLITERPPHFISPVLSTDIYRYFRQTLSGNVLIGYPAKTLTGPDMRVIFEAVTIGASRAATIITRLSSALLIRSFTVYTVWTPDYFPLVGWVEQVEGFYIAAAFCGLGFAIGPGIGKLMAELVTTGKTSLPVDAYRLERFADKPSER
jgi:glycine/D-amino acid oxidase-like deaminating enzyme